MSHQQVNELQHALWPISTHTHLDALLCTLCSGSQVDSGLASNAVQVVDSQPPVAGQLQHQVVRQRGFIPGIVQGREGAQQIVLFNAALLPAPRNSKKVEHTSEQQEGNGRTKTLLGDSRAEDDACLEPGR